MGTKKLLNTSSSPPIAYKRHCNASYTDKKQQEQNFLKPKTTNCENQTKNTYNNTCLLQKQNSHTMLNKLRNYFSQTTATLTTHFHNQQQRKRHQHHHYRHEKLTESHSIPIVQNNNNNNSSSISNTSTLLHMTAIVVTLVFLASFNGVSSNPVFVDNPSLAQFQSGRNIRHLPCIVRKSGRSGVCMFAIDCIKQNGTHLGTCIDRFYFGSCCDIKQEEELTEIADNSIDQNTISHHFTPESSTVPTSALFKLTTLSPIHQHSNVSSIIISSSSSSGGSSTSSTSSLATQQDNTQTLASTTLTDTPRPVGTTTKPGQQTTHKQSHFVIRTTAKPTKYSTGSKPSHNTTIKKKTTPSSTTTTKKATTTTSTTTTTTTRRPILTTTEVTQQRDELPLEVTTPPTKLFTYQIVETTAFTPTEATNVFDFVTTERIQNKTTKYPQTTSSSTFTIAGPKNTTTKPTTSTTTAETTQKFETTRLKPQTTRKPTTTKKPTSIKRTTVKPTRKPVTTTTTTTSTLSDTKLQNNTTSTQSYQTTTTSQTTFTTNVNRTTLSPRPKPRPTASIIKVPKPTTTTTTTTKATQKPTTTSTTLITTTTSTTEEEKIATTTTKKPTTPTKITTTTSATTTTPKTTAATTHKVTHKPTLSSTTHKPGLVTWTNIDGKPVDSNQPISDWVPVTSQAPLETHNKVEESSSESATFEEMDVSVSSSVSAVMNNNTVIISPPKKPITMQKPTTSTTSTSSSSSSASSSSSTSSTSTAATSKPITSSSSTDTQEADSSSSTDSTSQFTTEGLSESSTTSPTDFTSEDISTESLNLNSSTVNPITGLEGVDYRQVCGRRMFPEPRIVGGSNAAFGRWPWQISLRQWRTSTYLHKCGAALLNENWAITAAHCVDNVPPSDLLLRLGEYDLAEEEEPYGYQERRVQIVASHPQFDPRTFEYDLALLRFYEPVTFQPNIIPVCVPEDDENFIGQTAFVTGWGRLYEDGPLPSVLQEVAVPVINNTICESMYRAAGYIEHIPHIFICAGWKKGGYDSCEGDSGGPMVLQRESDKRFQLGGVISWGIGCAEANQPGVYTRISEFRDWINQILQF